MEKSNKPSGFTLLKIRHYTICVLCFIGTLFASISLCITDILILEIVNIVLIIVTSINFTYNTMKLFSIYKTLQEFKKIVMEVLKSENDEQRLR